MKGGNIMRFIIGMCSYPSIEGMHMSKVHRGFWDTIDAPDANEAAKIFYLSHYKEIRLHDTGPLYEVCDDGCVRLFKYYIEHLEFDDPMYVW